MVDEKLWSLVVELEMRSRLQQLKWRPLPNDVYQTILGGFVIRIEQENLTSTSQIM